MPIPSILAAAAAIAAPSTPAGWRAAAIADAAAFHRDILANHPGPVNTRDPGFAARETRAYAELRARAARVRDLAGYRAAIRGYVARFDDGHVQSWLDNAAPPQPARWPGFLTGYDGAGVQRVMARAGDAPVPIGARLVSCDGVAADVLAARTVGAFAGRWSMASTRAVRGGTLFVDRANPFVRRPATCRFDVNGTGRTVRLAWRPIAEDALDTRSRATSGIARPPIAWRTLANGTRWLSISSFDGDPDGAVAKALNPILRDMQDDRANVARAPAIVLDVRGNGGGSSDWSVKIARILWGEAAVSRIVGQDDGSYVEWRASPAVLAQMDDYRARYTADKGIDAATIAYFRVVDDGIRGAIAAHRPLWRETSEAQAGFAPAAKATTAAPSAAPPASLSGPVYVLTDPACGSACLDAVDLWRKLGAVQVGRETSGDTLYMDVREAVLPSGLTHIGVPMKVYRGRARGSNETWSPVHAYTGDLTDTSAVERWIATLSERRR